MTSKTTTPPILGPGPLKLPRPRTTTEARVLARLGGHASSDAWLPEGLSDDLDALRDRHLGLRVEAGAAIARVAELDARHRGEDAAHQARLKAAAGEGMAAVDAVKDTRTSPEDRGSSRAAALDRCWVLLEALSEHVVSVIEHVRQHEDGILGTLRQRVEVAQELRRQAEAALAEAKAAEVEPASLGVWVQRTADDHAPQTQMPPMPMGSTVNPEVLEGALSRSWQKRRDWHGATA